MLMMINFLFACLFTVQFYIYIFAFVEINLICYCYFIVVYVCRYKKRRKNICIKQRNSIYHSDFRLSIRSLSTHAQLSVSVCSRFWKSSNVSNDGRRRVIFQGSEELGMEFLLLLFSRFFLGYCSVVVVCLVKSKFYFRLIDLFNNLSFAVLLQQIMQFCTWDLLFLFSFMCCCWFCFSCCYLIKYYL